VLVAGGSNSNWTTGSVNGVTDFFLANNITAALTTGGGQLGGDLTARDQDIPTRSARSISWPIGVSTSVNGSTTLAPPRWRNRDCGEPLYIFTSHAVAGSAANMSGHDRSQSGLPARSAWAQAQGDNAMRRPWRTWQSRIATLNNQTPPISTRALSPRGRDVSGVQAENTAQECRSVTQLQTRTRRSPGQSERTKRLPMSTLAEQLSGGFSVSPC